MQQLRYSAHGPVHVMPPALTSFIVPLWSYLPHIATNSFPISQGRAVHPLTFSVPSRLESVQHRTSRGRDTACGLSLLADMWHCSRLDHRMTWPQAIAASWSRTMIAPEVTLVRAICQYAINSTRQFASHLHANANHACLSLIAHCTGITVY